MSGIEHELPSSLGSPAIRALTGAGYARLSELFHATEPEILALHGMGPKVVAKLRDLRAADRAAFASAAVAP